jgi:hypothetical protein
VTRNRNGQIFCLRQGCCADKKHTASQLVEYFLPIAIAGFKVFSRGKWTGSEEVFSCVCLLDATHGIFSAAFRQLAAERASTIQSGHDDGAIAFLDSVLQQGLSDSRPPEDTLRLLTSKWLATSTNWLDDPSGMLDIIVMKVVSSGRRAILAKMLATCSRYWERRQRILALQGARRTYRVLLKYEHWYSSPGMLIYGTLCKSLQSEERWAVVPIAKRSVAVRCLAFRMLSRAASTAAELIFWPEEKYPFKIFQLLQAKTDDEAKQMRDQMVKTPCLLDAVSRDYLNTYPRSRIWSPAARAELQTRAIIMDVCIGRIEARWSECRRTIKMCSLQSKAITMEYMSAKLVCRWIRQHRGAREKVGIHGVGPEAAGERNTQRGDTIGRSRRIYNFLRWPLPLLPVPILSKANPEVDEGRGNML